MSVDRDGAGRCVFAGRWSQGGSRADPAGSVLPGRPLPAQQQALRGRAAWTVPT